jgi:hypothetical protein
LATSFYIYQTFKEYSKINKDYIYDPLHHTKLIDIYIVPKLKVILVTQTNEDKERINMNKTIVHARNGTLPEELKELTKLIQHNDTVFDVKKGKLLFRPRFLRSPLYETKVDRFYGDLKKGKYKINYNHRFYDFIRDRVNLVLSEPNPA